MLYEVITTSGAVTSPVSFPEENTWTMRSAVTLPTTVPLITTRLAWMSAFTVAAESIMRSLVASILPVTRPLIMKGSANSMVPSKSIVITSYSIHYTKLYDPS